MRIQAVWKSAMECFHTRPKYIYMFSIEIYSLNQYNGEQSLYFGHT